MESFVSEPFHAEAGADPTGMLVYLENQLKPLKLKAEMTCACYGYSPELVPYGMLPSGRKAADLRRLVYLWVDGMVEQGMENFLCPMEQGADLMVAERVIARRSIADKPIRLIACLTYPGMRKDIGVLFREDFDSLCRQADTVVYASEDTGGRLVRQTILQTLLLQCAHLLTVYSGDKTPKPILDAQAHGLTVVEGRWWPTCRSLILDAQEDGLSIERIAPTVPH